MSMPEASRGTEDRSLGELFGELARDMSTLFRQEVALAKAEMSQKAAFVGKNVGMLVAGGALAYAGLLALIAAVIMLLAYAGMPWWASALLVGAVVTGVGGFLVFKGLNALKQGDLLPRHTVETLKEDAQWVQHQTRQRGSIQ